MPSIRLASGACRRVAEESPLKRRDPPKRVTTNKDTSQQHIGREALPPASKAVVTPGEKRPHRRCDAPEAPTFAHLLLRAREGRFRARQCDQLRVANALRKDRESVR